MSNELVIIMESGDQLAAIADEASISEMKSDSCTEISPGHESHPTDKDSNPAAVRKAGELTVLSFKVGGEEILKGYIDKFVTLNTTGRIILYTKNNIAAFLISDYKLSRWRRKQVQSRQDSSVSNYGEKDDENGSHICFQNWFR